MAIVRTAQLEILSQLSAASGDSPIAFTVPSGSNMLVIIFINENDTSNTQNISGVTYNAVSLTENVARYTRVSTSAFREGGQIFTLKNPATGSNNIAFTYAATGQDSVAYAMAYSGVDAVVDTLSGDNSEGTMTFTANAFGIMASFKNRGDSTTTLTGVDSTQVAVSTIASSSSGFAYSIIERNEASAGDYNVGHSTTAWNDGTNAHVGIVLSEDTGGGGPTDVYQPTLHKVESGFRSVRGGGLNGVIEARQRFKKRNRIFVPERFAA